MSHVFARLIGHGMVLVPHWPYRFEQYPDGAVHASRWTAEHTYSVTVRPGQFPEPNQVLDAHEGPDRDGWLIDTTAFRCVLPYGFVLASPRNPNDTTPFYLHGPDDALIFPQGPVPAEQVADPDVMVAPGQSVVSRRIEDGVSVIELAYLHEGRSWWQGHWMVPYVQQRALVLTAQAPEPHAAMTRTAVEAVVASLE